jgi:hypothetical protein
MTTVASPSAPTKKSRKKDNVLNPLVAFLEDNGVVSVRDAVRHELNSTADQVAVDNAVSLMREDDRFTVFDGVLVGGSEPGMYCCLRGQEPEGVPSGVTEPTPPPEGTGPDHEPRDAAPMKTLGEHMAEAEKTAAGVYTSNDESPAPVTPEDRLRFELEQHRKHAERSRANAQKYYHLKQAESQLQGELNELRDQIKEHVKVMAAHDGSPVDLQEPIPFGQASGDVIALPPAAGLTPPLDFQVPDDRKRDVADLRVSPELATCAYDLLRPESSEIQTATECTIDLYERKHLVLSHYGPIHDKDLFLVVPLYTKDDWQHLHAETFGYPVASLDQNPEAKAKRQVGGPLCGLVVKVQKGKQLVVGPLTDSLVLSKMVDFADHEGADDDGREPDGKELAANDG